MTYTPPPSDKDGGGSVGKQMADIRATLRREGALVKKQAELVGAGLSAGLAEKILAGNKPILAANKILKNITASGGATAKRLQNLFNQTAAGIAELAAATTDSIDDQTEAIKNFQAALRDTVRTFWPESVVTREIGSFERAVVSSMGNVKQIIEDALSNKLLTSQAAANLLSYAQSEVNALEAIGRKRDELANKRNLAEALMANVSSAIMSTGNVVNLFNKAQDALNQASQTTTDTLSQIVQKTVNAGRALKDFRVIIVSSIADPLKEASKTGASALIDSLKDVVNRTIEFRQNLLQLRALGLDQNLFKQIVDAGEEAGGETAKAILEGGADAVNELNNLMSKLEAVGSDLGEDLARVMYGAGIDSTNGLIAGLLAQEQAMVSTAETLANAFIGKFNSMLANLKFPTLPAANDVYITPDPKTGYFISQPLPAPTSFAGMRTASSSNVIINVNTLSSNGTQIGRAVANELAAYSSKSGSTTRIAV
jgi:hypothetical protein